MRTIATIGGLGFLPVAPGTAGSVVGVFLAWILSGSAPAQGIGCLAAIGLGLWSAGPVSKVLGDPDPSPVIIDEVAGMMVGLFALPVTWKMYLGSFLLFRFLDVFKPFGLRRLEDLPGSWGIMSDDLGAGLATNLILHAALFFFR